MEVHEFLQNKWLYNDKKVSFRNDLWRIKVPPNSGNISKLFCLREVGRALGELLLVLETKIINDTTMFESSFNIILEQTCRPDWRLLITI